MSDPTPRTSAHLPPLRRPRGRHDRAAIVGAIILSVILVVLVIALESPQSLNGIFVRGPAGGGSNNSTGGHLFPTPIRHVVTMFLENEAPSSVTDQPYEAGLCQIYACSTNYYAVCHPSLPNYIAATSGLTGPSGSVAACAGNESYPGAFAQTNIVDELVQAGVSWGAYMEGMNTSCQARNYPDVSDSEFANGSGGYAVRHDPFAYYTDLSTDGQCAGHVLPFDGPGGWDSVERSGSAPDYIWITPNVCHDGHNNCSAYDNLSNAAEGDHWLSQFIPTLQAQPWYASSVIFITYDESVDTNTSGYDNGTVAGGPVYFAAVSPFTEGTGAFTPDSSHYNLLSTTEWLLGLNSTGHNDASGAFPPMKGLFNFTRVTTVGPTPGARAGPLGSNDPQGLIGLTRPADQ
jgi:hypothetical protein